MHLQKWYEFAMMRQNAKTLAIVRAKCVLHCIALQSRLKMIMNCTIAAMLVPIMQGACLSDPAF